MKKRESHAKEKKPHNTGHALGMFLGILIWALLLNRAASLDVDFTFNGFLNANLSLDGTAKITPEGLLRLTNTTKQLKGHAFYPIPLPFRRSPAGSLPSFSSTFAFGIISEYNQLSGNGIAFVFSRSNHLNATTGSQYLGLVNSSNNGNLTNHVVAVELDTIFNPELEDINDNHLGIDVNGLRSINSYPAGYYTNSSGGFDNLTLISGEPMQVWVDYNGTDMKLNVTLSPLGVSKPRTPLLSSTVDLSRFVSDAIYVGFSSSTGSFLASHYILGWSFMMNGEARPLNLSSLPSLPPRSTNQKQSTLAIWVSLAVVAFVLLLVAGVTFIVVRKIRYSELLEDWELDYGPHRFSYKDLYKATKGFRDKELLGVGGFGRVYRGILPTTKIEVAVKKVSHDSRQGMREFVAEIVSIGRLRHRNLVQLLGYCRRKGELLLVYDYMPNASLDKFLFDQNRSPLDWSQRFRIIKGVSSGLLYLHEEWEQVVVHRDIKASNVLLDSELNGRLGDFGLARLYDHGTDPRTTRVVGTMGYIAPELTMTGKATKATDVFAFGTFLLEVACGRRPIEAQEELVLMDWVLENWRKGAMLAATDPTLGRAYVVEEVELVLKLGLLCSHPLPTARPSMRQVMQYLDGDTPLPELSSEYMNSSILALLQIDAFDDYFMSYPSSCATASLLSATR